MPADTPDPEPTQAEMASDLIAQFTQNAIAPELEPRDVLEALAILGLQFSFGDAAERELSADPPLSRQARMPVEPPKPPFSTKVPTLGSESTHYVPTPQTPRLAVMGGEGKHVGVTVTDVTPRRRADMQGLEDGS